MQKGLPPLLRLPAEGKASAHPATPACAERPGEPERGGLGAPLGAAAHASRAKLLAVASKLPKPWVYLAFAILGALQLVLLIAGWAASAPGSVPLWLGLLKTTIFVAMTFVGIRGWFLAHRHVTAEKIAGADRINTQSFEDNA